ncbi:MAG: hypothetical protein OQK09_02325 [Colwellia sp.]|nr:hypothetical protein [Colwellia sp.]MCW8865873.1 hypothetical protein [Colwellia sp.]MCW9080319.1 hypothetical protein [Colwellia sp.]
MKRIKLILITMLFTVSTVASSAEAKFNFVKGQRAQQDIVRDAQSKGPEIVAMLQLKPNMQVLDILGGGGYYSELLSESVGKNGRVYLHNNQAYMPWVEKELVARLKDNRLENVIRWDKETDNLALGKQQYDAIVFVLGVITICITVPRIGVLIRMTFSSNFIIR